jgi:hypothetical protein
MTYFSSQIAHYDGREGNVIVHTIPLFFILYSTSRLPGQRHAQGSLSNVEQFSFYVSTILFFRRNMALSDLHDKEIGMMLGLLSFQA